jgi:hypothetical protein
VADVTLAAGPPPDTRRRRCPRLPRTAIRRSGWVTLLGLLVAANGFVLARRFHFANDDLLQFVVARDEGLTWDYLTLNVWQHVAPYNRLGHWIVYAWSDLDPSLGLALGLVNMFLLLAAALWLMSELGLSAPRRVLALVAIGLSAPLAESAIWFDTSFHILAAIAVTLAVCAAHVRAVRTGAARWHVATLVVFVLGQLTQERPIFALPLIVLVDVLLLWRDLPWRTRFARLWALRLPLGALTVAALAIAAMLRAFVVVQSLEAPSWAVTLRTMLMAVTQYGAPAMVNQPATEPAGMTAQWVVLGCLVAAGTVLALVRRGNAGPVLFTAAVFLLYYGFLKFSPILDEDSVAANAERLHNAVYATVPATIALAHLRLPAWRRRTAAVRSRRAGRVRAVIVTAASAGLAGYLVVSGVGYLDRQWAGTTEARAYLDNVRAGSDEWSDPDVSLVPLTGHESLDRSWSRGLARHQTLLPLIEKGYVAGEAGSDPVLLDDRGIVRPAVVDELDVDPLVDSGGCAQTGSRLVDDADVEVGRVRADALFLRLTYRADDELRVRLAVGWGLDWYRNRSITTLPAGTHTWLIPVEASGMDRADLTVLGPQGAGLCVLSADAVRALLVDEDGRCREVDWYGRPTGVVPCPED